jgi:hypothetical protein
MTRMGDSWGVNSLVTRSLGRIGSSTRRISGRPGCLDFLATSDSHKIYLFSLSPHRKAISTIRFCLLGMGHPSKYERQLLRLDRMPRSRSPIIPYASTPLAVCCPKRQDKLLCLGHCLWCSQLLCEPRAAPHPGSLHPQRHIAV